MTDDNPSELDELRDAPAMLARVAAIYEAMLEQHGPTEAAVGWMRGSQKGRFKMIAGLLPADGMPISVADLGCGYGAFFDFLLTCPGIALESYAGYDISESMIRTARSRIRDARAQFQQSLIVTRPADFCIAGGTYNVMLDAEPDRWAAYVLGSLRNLSRMSRIAFTVSILLPVEDGDPDIFRAAPGRYVDFCRDVLGGRTRLIEGYGLPEWTLMVERA